MAVGALQREQAFGVAFDRVGICGLVNLHERNRLVTKVNRILDAGAHWLEKGLWEGKIAAEIAKPVEVKIDIATTYNEANRSLSVSVDNEFLVEGSTNENLLVYLIEDGIISPQDSLGEEVTNYKHRNMLRATLNTVWGENLSTSVIATGTKITKNYTYAIPAAINNIAINVDNCSIVAFVHNNDTKVVRQAAIKKIK